MASRTQIRLEQLTGSAVDLKTEAQQYVTPAAASSLTGSDVRDLFGMVGAALSRIHGAASDEPFNNTAGIISGSHGIVDFSGTSAFGGGNFGTIRGLNGSGVLNRLDLVGTTVAVFGNTTERIAVLNNGVTRFKDSAGETVINITTAGTNQVQIGGTDADVVPGTNSASSLGVTGTRWSDFYSDAATITNNLTVGGDLTVNGATTTINTTNLNVEDSIIGLGFSGSNPSPNGDRGILFGKASIGQAIPGLWYDAGNSDFNFATSITDAASSSFGTTTAYQNVNAGDLIVYNGANKRGEIKVVANDLVISSSAGNDLMLDSNSGKIFLQKDTIAAGFIQADSGENGNGLILSSSANEALLLDSNIGLIQFGKDATAAQGGKVSTFIAGTANTETFSFIKSNDTDNSNYTLKVETHTDGTFNSQFVAISGSLRLKSPNAAGSYVALRAPDTVTEGGGNYTLTFPADNGESNQYLQTNGSGVLTWASVATAADSLSKAIRIITGSHAAGAEVKIGAPAEITAGDAITGLSIAGSQGKALDVFVNGQLLISGSQSERSAGTRDYNIVADPTNSLEFAFQLEADDVVVVVKRDS